MASVCRTRHIHTNFSNSFYSVAPLANIEQ